MVVEVVTRSRLHLIRYLEVHGGSGGGGELSESCTLSRWTAGGTGNTPPVSPPQGNNGGAGAPGQVSPSYPGGGSGGGAGAAGFAGLTMDSRKMVLKWWSRCSVKLLLELISTVAGGMEEIIINQLARRWSWWEVAVAVEELWWWHQDLVEKVEVDLQVMLVEVVQD